ncbi:MAG: 6-phosphogluconate dehydrogenase (decarboxylating) [Candidatus Pacebacteria bacterium CG10_big_fil_rev_8_21_14_0_10_56_10]|nr:MAG: 6-phosphogluconate dehydrogenase (decarboxylating) [Candidatus Pacebacteria bacterium CG10_big_fil_rev_8_21_14_0_10_56_10]
MQLGYIGLGKMGKNMALRLVEKGHQLVVWNRSPEPRQEVAAAGAVAVETVEELVGQLRPPRVVWLMLPAGDVTGQMVEQLVGLLTAGDTVIDGANSNYNHTIKRAEMLSERQLRFLDAGVSGGPAGARQGACVMIGGDEQTFRQLEQLFQDIAAPEAYQFFAGAGAGHFVKMVHNGIEYGMMQAIGEGFEVMKRSPFNLDLQQVARVYNRQSVITSRLIGWLESGYLKHGPDLTSISGEVSHSGEGQWTVEAARELGVAVPIIEEALQFRIDSQGNPSYTGQVVSVLRNEFGGHDVEK